MNGKKMCKNKENREEFIVAKITKRAIELLGSKMYESYMRIIKAILKDGNFDVIILMDRKGSDIFRCFFRLFKSKFHEEISRLTEEMAKVGEKQEILAKLEDELSKIKEQQKTFFVKLPIIISSRQCASYTFNGNEKVIIFDDVITKGRNIEQFICNLHRRGIKDISFTALAYHENLLDKQTTNSIVIEPDNKNEPVIRFKYDDEHKREEHKGYFTKVKKIAGFEFTVSIFFPLEEEGAYCPLIEVQKNVAQKPLLKNRDFFFSDDQSKKIAHTFNRLIHYSLTPYTAYTSYGRFLCAAKTLKEAIESKLDNHNAKKLDVAACTEEKVKSWMCYCKTKNSKKRNYQNGYFSGMRVFLNDFGEVLFQPFLTLPSLTTKQVGELYESFKFDSFEIGGKNPLYFEKMGKDFQDNNIYSDGGKYIKHLSRKSQLESAERRVVSLLMAVETVNFLNNEPAIKQAINLSNKDDKLLTNTEVEKFIINTIAKSLKRYFLPTYLSTNAEISDEAQQKICLFLTEAISIVKENPNNIFDFSDVNKYPHVDNLLENYTSILNEVDIYNCYRENEITENYLEMIKGFFDTEHSTKFSNLSEEIKTEGSVITKLDNELDKFISVLMKADEKMIDRKFYPLPLFEIVQFIMGKFSTKDFSSRDELFLELMIIICSCVEDGIISTCIYTERCYNTEVEEDNFLTSYYTQRGELSLIKHILNFINNFTKIDGVSNIKYQLQKVDRLINVYYGDRFRTNEERSSLKETFYKRFAFLHYGENDSEKTEQLIRDLKFIEINKRQTDFGWQKNKKLLDLVNLFECYLIDRFDYKKRNIGCFLEYKTHKV